MIAKRNRFTLTPTLPRSTTKAEWKQAHQCARVTEKMLTRSLKEMEVELQKAFRDLVVFGTCRIPTKR